MDQKEQLLVILAEESTETTEAALALANEITQAGLRIAKQACKSVRFGEKEINPLDGKTPANNLVGEFNDMVAALELLQETGVELPGLFDRNYIEKKKERVRSMMFVSEQRGLLIRKN